MGGSRQRADHEWLSEGLEDHEPSRSAGSATKLLSKLAGPLRRISGSGKTSKRQSKSFEGVPGSRTAGAPGSSNPFAGAALLFVPEFLQSSRSSPYTCRTS